MGIILSSSSSLKSMSLVITIIVILFIVLAFIGLFFLVTHFFKKCINLGLEDNLVKKEILSEIIDWIKTIFLSLLLAFFILQFKRYI